MCGKEFITGWMPSGFSGFKSGIKPCNNFIPSFPRSFACVAFFIIRNCFLLPGITRKNPSLYFFSTPNNSSLSPTPTNTGMFKPGGSLSFLTSSMVRNREGIPEIEQGILRLPSYHPCSIQPPGTMGGK